MCKIRWCKRPPVSGKKYCRKHLCPDCLESPLPVDGSRCDGCKRRRAEKARAINGGQV